MQLQQRPTSLVLLPLLLLASSTSIITTASAQHVFSCQAHRPEGVDKWLPSCCLNYTLAADLPYPSPPDIPKDWGPYYTGTTCVGAVVASGSSYSECLDGRPSGVALPGSIYRSCCVEVLNKTGDGWDDTSVRTGCIVIIG